MTVTHDDDLIARAALTIAEHRAVADLLQICNTAEGLDLKLNMQLGPPYVTGETHQLLYYADRRLAGFCSIEGLASFELCGMVHPAYRRRGIGQLLLDTALDVCRRRGVSRVLLICETGSQSGQHFVASLRARQAEVEQRMELVELQPAPPFAGAFTLEPAVAGDAGAIADVVARAFGDPVDEYRRRVERDMRRPDEQWYLARVDGIPAGGVRVWTAAPRVYLYAVGVAPEMQGRGIGRQMLTQLCARLLQAGWTRIALEVLPDNAAAQALYRACGFRHTTTYEYYALPL